MIARRLDDEDDDVLAVSEYTLRRLCAKLAGAGGRFRFTAVVVAMNPSRGKGKRRGRIKKGTHDGSTRHKVRRCAPVNDRTGSPGCGRIGFVTREGRDKHCAEKITTAAEEKAGKRNG